MAKTSCGWNPAAAQFGDPGMKERPILYSGPMVRARREGRKSQTRRVIKGVFKSFCEAEGVELDCIKDVDGLPSRLDMAPDNWELNPYGKPGDRLWVRECFYCDVPDDSPDRLENLYYRADATPGSKNPCCELIPECDHDNGPLT